MSDLYLGLISGTSLDGADAVLAEFGDGDAVLHASLSLPYPDDLMTAVRRAANPAQGLTADEFGLLDARLGEHFAKAALRLVDQAGVARDRVRAIGSHGQTVAHEITGRFPYSVQLGDPNRVAERTGITTVADFRRRDIAAGGHGAPLMSAFHEAVFGGDRRDTAVLNLGGIANLTLLPADGEWPVTGFDTGPANCLLDDWARRHLGRDFDEGGRLAAGGSVDDELLRALARDPYFAQEPPKSTGTQHFSQAWLNKGLGDRERRPEDVAATLVELTAVTVAEALGQTGFKPVEVVCCGGGAHNDYLVARLAARLPDADVVSSAERGIAPAWVEAAGFAWLARQTVAGRPGNRHSVTGAAGPRILGGIYPGS